MDDAEILYERGEMAQLFSHASRLSAENARLREALNEVRTMATTGVVTAANVQRIYLVASEALNPLQDQQQ